VRRAATGRTFPVYVHGKNWATPPPSRRRFTRASARPRRGLDHADFMGHKIGRPSAKIGEIGG
jgi:hypothetical protein